MKQSTVDRVRCLIAVLLCGSRVATACGSPPANARHGCTAVRHRHWLGLPSPGAPGPAPGPR